MLKAFCEVDFHECFTIAEFALVIAVVTMLND
jgi:hypothetical protein